MRFSKVMLGRVLSNNRVRQCVVFGLQAAMVVASGCLAYLIRFDFNFAGLDKEILFYIAFALIIKLPAFHICNLNHGWWRYSGLSDLVSIFKAVTAAQLIFGFLHWADLTPGFPRSVLIIDYILLLIMLGGARMLFRLYHENGREFTPRRRRTDQQVLIVGAGDAGISLVRYLKRPEIFEGSIAGFVDDSDIKKRAILLGLPVLGKIKDIPEIVKTADISSVIIAIPSLKKTKLQEIIDLCLEAKVPFKTIPSIAEMIELGSNIYKLRSVRVEDLLGREQIELDKSLTKKEIAGRVVMVTGAGGTIGAELVRQILGFYPRKLILFERNEYFLFSVSQEMKRRYPDAEIVPVTGDVGDRPCLDATFLTHRPDLVYHAAAYKHVHLTEVNAREAVKNNVFGTAVLAEAASDYEVEKFVMISTDKAVNPVGVMGYTKRLAELIIQRLSKKSRTKFISVRFGNVLGSSGSAVEVFQKQIESGGPVTVTDPNAERFFMTAPEAVELVLNAGTHGNTGEIYMLDMGEPVKILDLAYRMIKLSDPEGKREIGIEFTGLKTGEKIREELVWKGEDFAPSVNDKIFVLRNKVPTESLPKMMEGLRLCIDRIDCDASRVLKAIVNALDGRFRGGQVEIPPENFLQDYLKSLDFNINQPELEHDLPLQSNAVRFN